MRRLPIFFLVDCSESMIGDNHLNMEKGLSLISTSLRTDPNALESVYISVIAFAGIAKIITPFVNVASFYPPKLPIGSGTHLGDALNLLMDNIDSHVTKTTSVQKGDWRPIVYLFTDGKPTDDTSLSLKRWREYYVEKTTLIAIALGKISDLNFLHELTDNVLLFEASKPSDFNKFIHWITASVTAQSNSIGTVNADRLGVELDESYLKIVKQPSLIKVDEDCAVFVGRCQKTRKPYIIKYEKEKNNLVAKEFSLDISRFVLSGCYPVDEEFFTWSSPMPHSAKELSIGVDKLYGIPSCPYCGNSSAFAVCGCGKFLCVNQPSLVLCPWCQEEIMFQASTEIGESLSVQRGRG